jgi:hypothetical protein
MPKLSPSTSRRGSAYGVRLSPAALAKLRDDAERKGLSVPQYLEALIMETDLSQTNYFAQQAAVCSMTALGVVVSMAAEVLTQGRAREVRNQAAARAARLFGEVQRRPSTVGEEAGEDDPRVLALFEAFGAG